MIYNIVHSIIWVLGIIYGIIPLLMSHKFGLMGKELYPVDEYFSMRIIALLILAAVGSLIWSVNAKLVRKTEQSLAHKKIWVLCLLGTELILITLGLLHLMTGYSYFILGITVNIIFFYKNLSYLKTKDEFANVFHRIYAWLSTRASWNAIFYFVVFLILITHNTLLIYNIDNIDNWHKFSIFLNRFFNQLAMVALLYIVIQSSLYVAPKWSRSLIWIISSIIPLLIISDYFTHSVWNTSFMSLINSTGIEGFMDLENALKGGGIKTPILHLSLLVTGSLVVLFLLVWGCNVFSRRIGFKISPRTAVVVALLSILGATLEQAIGSMWKNTREQAMESSEFDFQVSMVKADFILAEFQVEFKNHAALQFDSSNERKLNFKRKPDIYLIFVESYRADALTPEISPQLYQFKLDDAQKIEKSWASSNGTHVSWFGTFSGRLPLYWKMDKDIKEQDGWPGLNAFRMFKNEGYELSAYIATELDYRQMGKQFFGQEGDIFKTIRDNSETDPIFDQHISERERLLFEDLKEDIKSRDDGGHFDIVGLDSSHFFYTWHKDFKPPFNPYSELSYLPSNPDDEELALVINKYHNSIAWCDYLIGDFLSFLKEEKKYDESIIIVLGDHGEELQEHGGWLHVSSLEAEQIRVPMLIKWPKSYGRGESQKTASQLDVLPSLLDYLSKGNDKARGLPDVDFPGNSLLESNDQTIIAYTGMGGKTMDALVLTRGNYKAHFSWVDYWNWKPSNHIHLTQLYGPEGRITLETDEEYLVKLKELFPDVKKRFFTRFGTKKLDWEEAVESEGDDISQ